jgi:sulfoxide reductase catalytic subunit YedY
MRTPPRNTGFQHPYSSEITPKAVYEDRRQHLQQLLRVRHRQVRPGAQYAHTLKTRPWTVASRARSRSPAATAGRAAQAGAMEERIYRLRCVEGWSMVIPWVGYSLADADQAGGAHGQRQVRGVRHPGRPKATDARRAQQRAGLAVCGGLRMDEAMHPLTLLAFGMYGEVLPNQNGAPLRLVVPWKYGFKSAKSHRQDPLRRKAAQDRAGCKAARSEYGFYSNVNPKVDHPRWSQATERRIGEDGLFAKKRPTLMFNGYEAQVGQLYAGMDLKKFY